MTAQEVKFSNFYESTLNGILASGATAMTLTAAPTSDGTSGIAAPYYLVIDPDNASNREVVLITSASGTTVSVMTRDVEGRHTTDPTHVDGTTVRMAVIKEMFEDVHDRVDNLPTNTSTDTLTNKTIDADNNTLSNIEVDNLKSGVLDTDISSVSGSDDTLASAKATKAYADTKLPLAGGTMTGAINAGDQEISAAVLKDYAETDVALSSASGVVAIDLANGNTGSVTLGHNVTDIDFTNVPTDGTSSFTLKVTQDGTGSRTMAIDAITVNGGGNVTGLTPGAAGLTLSTGAADIDLVSFLFFGASTPLINSLLDFS